MVTRRIQSGLKHAMELHTSILILIFFQVVQSDGSTYSQLAAARKQHIIHAMGVDGACFKPLRTAPCSFEWSRVAEHSTCGANGYPQPTPRGSEWDPGRTHGQGKCAILPLGRLKHEISMARSEKVVLPKLRDSFKALN